MDDQYWSWIVTIIGVIGFWLAGQKVWWSWYVNIANQILWGVFAVVTEQWGFLIGIPLYLSVFVQNAYKWTRDHRRDNQRYHEMVEYCKADVEMTMKLFEHNRPVEEFDLYLPKHKED